MSVMLLASPDKCLFLAHGASSVCTVRSWMEVSFPSPFPLELLVVSLLSGSFFSSYSKAAVQNFTLNDTKGDDCSFSLSEYIPSNSTLSNNGPSCSGSSVLPNLNDCVDQKYHGATVSIDGMVGTTSYSTVRVYLAYLWCPFYKGLPSMSLSF